MSERHFVGPALSGLSDNGALKAVSRVTLLLADESAVTAGDDTGLELTASCPSATQKMAQAVLDSVKGYSLHAYEAQDVQLDPAAELGDGVTVGGLYSAIVRLSDDGSGYPSVSAPGKAELEEEYPLQGPVTKELERKLTLGGSYYGVRLTRGQGLEVVKAEAGGSERSRATLNADTLAFYNDDGEQALYFDVNAGRFKFRGDVEVTGGSMNINGNFIVDPQGNLTLKGDIDLSGGTITWGGNQPESGISAAQARTMINSTLVSSPNIAGARFWNLEQDTWIEIAQQQGLGGWGLTLRGGGWEEVPIFGIYNGDFGTVMLNGKGLDFILVDASGGTVIPYGTWDFSRATVVGL